MDEMNLSGNTQEVAAPENIENQQQATEPVNDPVQNGNVEVVDPQQERPVQTAEQNALYAKIRREAETKAQDRMISEMYGQSHGIHTYADYQRAIQEQKAKEEAEKMGIDPQFYSEFNSMKSKLDSYEREKTLLMQDSKLSNDPKLGNIYKEWKNDVVQIADNYGVDYDTAFTLLTRERLSDILSKSTQQVQQETIQKINANGLSSPGSLGSENANPKQSISSMADKDFDEMMKRVARGEKIKL